MRIVNFPWDFRGPDGKGLPLRWGSRGAEGKNGTQQKMLCKATEGVGLPVTSLLYQIFEQLKEGTRLKG